MALNTRDCVYPCLSDEKQKAIGPFYLVPMLGEVGPTHTGFPQKFDNTFPLLFSCLCSEVRGVPVCCVLVPDQCRRTSSSHWVHPWRPGVVA